MMKSALKSVLLPFLTYDQAEKVKTFLCAVLYYSGLASVIGLFMRRSRAGARILMFHSVSEERTFWDNRISPRRFRQTLRYLNERYRIVPMAHIIERLRRNAEVPSDWIALTFDDGYADNVAVAFPDLANVKAPATFFVPSGIVRLAPEHETSQLPYLFFDAVEDMLRRTADVPDGGGQKAMCFQSDGRRSDAILRTVLSIRARDAAGHQEALAALAGSCGTPPRVPRNLYVSADDLRRLDEGGMEVGSHGVSHADLARCSENDAMKEISDSKAALESILGRPVVGFAYPFGKRASIGPRGSYVDQSGYNYAVTTEFGSVRAGADRFALPRIAVRDAALVRLKVNLLGIPI